MPSKRSFRVFQAFDTQVKQCQSFGGHVYFNGDGRELVEEDCKLCLSWRISLKSMAEYEHGNPEFH